MFNDSVRHIAEQDSVHNAVQHAAEHGAGGSDFIMGHLLSHPVIPLPTVAGIDLTITNHVVMMFVSGLLLIVAFGWTFRNPRLVPKGFANALESIVEYVYNEAIKPNLGPHSRMYAPYLLTAFFFILLCNFLGLVPFGATATGNIGVTLAMAIITLLVGQVAGIRKFGFITFYKHIVPPGLPVFIIPIMLPVEIMSLIAKHFSLAIRLFANMVGGHITILAIMSIIFMFQNWLISPLPLVLILFSSLLEVLITFIQAYVFTTLSAVFIGTSLAEEH